MFEKALEIRMEAYSGSHPCIAEIKNNIAMLHFSQVCSLSAFLAVSWAFLTFVCLVLSGQLHGGSAAIGGCVVHMRRTAGSSTPGHRGHTQQFGRLVAQFDSLR